MAEDGAPLARIDEAVRDPRIVRAAILLPDVAIELCDFPTVAADRLLRTEERSVLSLGLSPISPSEGRFRGGARFARFGSLSFRPAGVASEMLFAGGAFETIRCRFEAGALPRSLAADALRDDQLAACFDIRAQRIEDGMLRLAEEASEPDGDSPRLAAALVETIIVDLARAIAQAGRLGERRAGGIAPRQLRRVLARMEAAGPAPSIAELAAACGLSRFHFLRCFRATMGTSPGAYMLSARMARAKSMLAADGPNIAEIAAALGYRSTAAFSAAFRRTVGRPPVAYRASIRS